MKEDYAKLYSPFHENQKLFPGYTVVRYADTIASLVRLYNPASMLDYGCGKGYQYLARRVHEKWGGMLPVCYDIGVRQLNARPEGKFDAIICTDMLEHIATEDLPEILSDIFSFSTESEKSFVVLGISCAPSKNKALPDGRNVHLTVQPPAWWNQMISKHSPRMLRIVDLYGDV